MTEIRDLEGRKRPLFALDLWSRDAIASYCRARWPTNTAKSVAREFELSLDEARGVISSRASQTTIDKILKHRNGGWKIAIPVLGAVIGSDLDGFLAQEQERLSHERKQYEAQERHLAEMVGKVRTLVPLWFSDRPQPDPRPTELLGEPSSALGGEKAGDDLAPPIQFVRRRP